MSTMIDEICKIFLAGATATVRSSTHPATAGALLGAYVTSREQRSCAATEGFGG